MSATWAPGERLHVQAASLGDEIAHSALWSAVSHLVRHQPILAVVAIGVLAGAFILWRRSGHRRSSGGRR